MTFEELVQNGRGVGARRPKSWRVPFLFGGAHPRPLRFRVKLSIEWLGTQMKRSRVCFLLHVKPELITEYKEAHRSVWPEMQQALRETGWHNYSLFLRADGLLVGYVETPDFEKATSGMAASAVNERWQSAMAHFFVGDGGALSAGDFLPLEEVFHLD
jgi:L-rhamnose mutarotase